MNTESVGILFGEPIHIHTGRHWRGGHIQEHAQVIVQEAKMVGHIFAQGYEHIFRRLKCQMEILLGMHSLLHKGDGQECFWVCSIFSTVFDEKKQTD